LLTAYLLKNLKLTHLSGSWGIGLATRNAELGNIPNSKEAWYCQQDGLLIADGKEVGKLETEHLFHEGDIVVIPFKSSSELALLTVIFIFRE